MSAAESDHRPAGPRRAARPARLGAKAAFAASGLLVGSIPVGSLTASAADTSAAAQTGGYGTPARTSPTAAAPRRHVDESRSQRPDEHLLSGTPPPKSGRPPGQVPGRDRARGV